MIPLRRRAADAAAVARLREAGLHPVLARLFAARGVREPAQVDTTLSGLLRPDTLHGVDRMAGLLADAVEADRSILVVGDYDADGATASAVGVLALRAMGARADYLVPNRFDTGYGLTPEVARLAAARRPDLLVTVDNGIAAHAGIEEANRLGLQVLVTDHHLPGDTLPPAACIVNPNLPQCGFPSKHLAGVGVLFYVMLQLRAVLRARGRFDAGPSLAGLLDLVALGTVADVVCLDENNRTLVAQGLARIRAGRCRPGILALFAASRRDPARASAGDLGFSVGPRLNAAGRLEDMSLGVECLLADDPVRAGELATRLDALNRERRSIEARMRAEAEALMVSPSGPPGWGICLYDARWHPGVVGLLASRLREQYQRPVIAFADAGHGDELKGSGRSIPGLHLRDVLDRVSRLHPALAFRFGGHAAAAGVTLARAHFDAFADAFDAAVAEALGGVAPDAALDTDGPLRAGEATLELARLLRDQVWGQGFAPPRFDGCLRVLEQRPLGENHLRLRLALDGGAPLAGVLFAETGPLPSAIDAVYELAVDDYGGNARPQIILHHWQAAAAPHESPR